ncbi:MAG TPA: SH3 domain-containing protein [Rhodothermales bacterium]|nr:SH3 domain-containing protein [Rhodothermales bacterium]
MRALAFFLFVLAAGPATAQVMVLRPVDQAVDDPSFVTFRARLLAALAGRDTAAVLGAFAPDARLSFGDDPPGPEGVRQMWLGRTPRGPRSLWVTLARAVAMGSVRDSNNPGFVSAPYVYNAWPDGVDPFEHGAVVGENVRVRATPRLDGEVRGTLSYAIVPVEAWDDPAGWARIRLTDGQTGYVSTDYVWSPVGYRVGFEKQPAGWRIVFFIAGD